jgi:hypothetical protein
LGGGLGFCSRRIRSCVGHSSTSKIETNDLLNGHRSSDKNHVRQKARENYAVQHKYFQ